METRKLNYKGKNIAYSIHGEGQPVMLVHGFGELPEVWKNQYSHPGLRWIVPHLPGTGESDMTDDMSMEGMAACLLAILDEENITSCIMIGHSMGGYITMAFAEKYMSRLKAFGLFHSSAFADTEAKKETRKKGIAFIKEHGAAAFLDTTIPNLYSPVTKKEQPELPAWHKKTAESFRPEALIAYYEAMIARPDRTEVLKNTRVPVLFILGREDQAVPLEDGLKQCHLAKLSYVEILENSAHMGMLEEKGLAARYVLDFIAGTAADSSINR